MRTSNAVAVVWPAALIAALGCGSDDDSGPGQGGPAGRASFGGPRLDELRPSADVRAIAVVLVAATSNLGDQQTRRGGASHGPSKPHLHRKLPGRALTPEARRTTFDWGGCGPSASGVSEPRGGASRCRRLLAWAVPKSFHVEVADGAGCRLCGARFQPHPLHCLGREPLVALSGALHPRNPDGARGRYLTTRWVRVRHMRDGKTQKTLGHIASAGDDSTLSTQNFDRRSRNRVELSLGYNARQCGG